MNEQLPEWYQSTQGPQLSMTLKATLGLLLPTIKVLFPHVTIFNEQIDAVIDALMIVGFGLYALYGYVRAKQGLQNQVQKLGRMIEKGQ